MASLLDDALLDALAGRMFDEANRNPDPEERKKAGAMGNVFACAAREFRSPAPSALAHAVLAQAKLGSHLIEED